MNAARQARRPGKIDPTPVLLALFALIALACLVAFLITMEPGSQRGVSASGKSPVADPPPAIPIPPAATEEKKSIPEPLPPPDPVDPDGKAASKKGPRIEFPALPRIGDIPRIRPATDPDPKVVVKPEPAIKSKIEPKPDPKPQVRHPIPDPDQQREAEKLIREIYAADYARKKPAEMVALAGKLLQEGSNSKESPAAQYVLFREAADLAGRAGDFLVALRAIDQLSQWFSVNLLEMKLACLGNAVQIPQMPAVCRTIAEASLHLVDDAVDEDNYPAAIRLLEIADGAGKRSNSPVLLQRIQARNREVAETAKAFLAARAAAAMLEKVPDDPDASQQWGRFLTFYKGNWGAGLPLVAQGSDTILRNLADRDLAGPAEPKAQLDVGDAWWELADGQPPVPRKQLQLRARHWYEQAVAKLGGFSKTRAEKRIRDTEQLVLRDDLPADKSTPTVTPTKSDPYAVHLAAGVNFYKLGQYSRAAASFEESLKLRPDDGKASAYLREARWAEALANGYAAVNMGELNDAVEHFQEALKYKPNDPIANNALATLASAKQNGGGKGKGKGGK
jgi:tetratricopeptide (TPR) repeat protein